MKEEKGRRKKSGITRREFMQYSAAAGAALAAPGLFAGCSDSTSSTSSGTEYRTYYFDLSNADPLHDFHLKAAEQYVKLKKMDQETLKTARESNPFLSLVPDENITHYVKDAPISSEYICLCWVVGEVPEMDDGTWNMPLMFYHLPKSALKAAARWPGATPEPGANKLRLYGADPGVFAGDPDAYLWEDDLKDSQDHATALVFGHQELICGQSASATHIQKNIISPQPKTRMLAAMLQSQGPATENPGGWATQKVYINPDTKKPYLNSRGQKQYNPRWSQETLEGTGGAIHPSLNQAKNDTTLGANITHMPVDQENPGISGKIWKVNDGITTVDADAQIPEGDVPYIFSEAHNLHGYRAYNLRVDENMKVTFHVHNWYLRYLGIYVRFLDANNNPIKVSDLPQSTTQCFPYNDKHGGTYDLFAKLLDAEFEILGIPLASTTEEFSFFWPEMASKALILAGGMGSGSKKYPATLGPGDTATGILNLACPGLFLAMAAPTALVGFYKGFAMGALMELVEDMMEVLAQTEYIFFSYDDPKAFLEIVEEMGEWLLSVGARFLIKRIMVAVGKAEVLDDIPILGAILDAIAAAGLVAELAETGAEICRSPRTYCSTLSLIHDIHVTINHDPKDFEFPATATHYVLKAFFDSGTPWVSGPINMPGTSWSDPLHYTFPGVPYGGKVKVMVAFYSDNDWLAGKGLTDNIMNDETAANVTITIKEHKVPLRINTQYSHKEKTILNAGGDLAWEAAEAPAATKVDLSCGNLNGDLCELTCITVSEHFATAGYTWKSYSDDVESCDSGGLAQLFQFSGMSIAQNPESGHKTSGCGFFNMVRIVYDLMGSQNNNFYLDSTGEKHLARQIRLALNEKPDFDGPHSNKSWGRFNLPSDAYLLHPSRKLISINSEYDKIEVLSLPDHPGPDDDAPLARVYSATGTREGLISGPICGAIASDGAILVLESKNMRIQAFDLGGNPAKHFGPKRDKYYVPLKAETYPVTYLDMAVEYVGYLYVLSYITKQGLYQYRLDIYTPEGDWLCRTTGVNASKLDVDFWRNAYTLNYERLTHPDGTLPTVTEPSVSQWIPSTP